MESLQLALITVSVRVPKGKLAWTLTLPLYLVITGKEGCTMA